MISATLGDSYRSPLCRQNCRIKSKKPTRLVGGFAPAEVSLSYRARSNAQILAKRNHENFFLKAHPGKATGVGGLNHERAFASNRMGFLAQIFFSSRRSFDYLKDNQTNQRANEYGAFSRCVAPNGADFGYLFSFAIGGRGAALEKMPRNSGWGVGRPPSERMR